MDVDSIVDGWRSKGMTVHKVCITRALDGMPVCKRRLAASPPHGLNEGACHASLHTRVRVCFIDVVARADCT